jgi:hypothetical protein
MWLTAIFVFGVTIGYLVTQEARVNAPGELGEMMSALGIVFFLILVIISFLILLFYPKK